MFRGAKLMAVVVILHSFICKLGGKSIHNVILYEDTFCCKGQSFDDLGELLIQYVSEMILNA